MLPDYVFFFSRKDKMLMWKGGLISAHNMC